MASLDRLEQKQNRHGYIYIYTKKDRCGGVAWFWLISLTKLPLTQMQSSILSQLGSSPSSVTLQHVWASFQPIEALTWVWLVVSFLIHTAWTIPSKSVRPPREWINADYTSAHLVSGSMQTQWCPSCIDHFLKSPFRLYIYIYILSSPSEQYH